MTLTTSNETSSAKPTSWFQRRSAARTGVVISVLGGVFLLFDAGTKLLQVPFVVQSTVQAGYTAQSVPIMGALLLFGLILYTVPRTASLGALVITGYLGGAVDSNLRLGMPVLSFQLLPVYVAVLVWGGLYLRSAALRELVRVGR